MKATGQQQMTTQSTMLALSMLLSKLVASLKHTAMTIQRQMNDAGTNGFAAIALARPVAVCPAFAPEQAYEPKNRFYGSDWTHANIRKGIGSRRD